MSLCLNMIVKNESKIICRLLESVLSIIDTYCICDTGSTDDTIELIKTFFKNKSIPGKIIHEPFKDFAYNRSHALFACVGMSDYILLLDADMIIQLGSFDKSSIKKYDAYHIFQGNEDFYYKNLRIVKNNGLYSYAGVTHEYINTPEDKKFDIPKEQMFILDVGDGGSKSDKFERDVRLLLKGIEDEPTNVRYHFYLANSYNDSGQHDKAIDMYKKRIALGGWAQEVWQSYYKMGLIYEHLKQPEMAIFNWLEALHCVPNRIENIYEIVKYYRIVGKQKLAYNFYKIARELLDTLKEDEKDSFLFLKNDIYTYKLDFEYSILACYLGVKIINDSLYKIFNNSNDSNIVHNTLSNMKFYKNILVPKSVIDFTNSFEYSMNNLSRKYNSSSASIICNKYGYTMNVRYVNYYIKPNNQYANCDDHIITLNKRIELTSAFKVLSETILNTPFVDRRYIGVEDVKIFKNVFIGTGFHKNNRIGLNYGNYEKLEYNELKSGFNDNECEKNWCLYSSKDDIRVVYGWEPLTLCKINETTFILDKIEEKPMPKLFKHVRGSSNGFTYKNEIWFVTHMVSYENPRHYYHLIVVFDLNMNLLRYSFPFKFEGEAIEYCLGIIVEDDRIILPYSTWDRTTKLAIYDKSYIENIFFL